jgi:hypothetical protein
MLSIDFYKRFRDYKFILIYQLDAYVFRDELEYWCEQDYDFIGAPLIENGKGSDKKIFYKTQEIMAIVIKENRYMYEIFKL